MMALTPAHLRELEFKAQCRTQRGEVLFGDDDHTICNYDHVRIRSSMSAHVNYPPYLTPPSVTSYVPLSDCVHSY